MATIPAHENEFPQVLFAEGAAPSTPAAGLVVCYVKSDGLLYCKDDAGTETSYSSAISGLAAHLADTSDAHDASAVSVLDSGNHFTATDVEAALAELFTSIAASGISPTILDTKGDLIVATAADTAAKFPAGADGTVLMADSAQTEGMKYAALRTQLGTTSIGASFDTTKKGFYKKITMAKAGYIMSIAVAIKGQSSGAGLTLQCGVMSDNSGTPLNTIAYGSSGSTRTVGGEHTSAGSINGTARFVTVPIGLYVAAGDYWLVVVNEGNSGSDVQVAYSSGTGNDRTRTGTDGFHDHSVVASSTGTNDHSIFCNVMYLG